MVKLQNDKDEIKWNINLIPLPVFRVIHFQIYFFTSCRIFPIYYFFHIYIYIYIYIPNISIGFLKNIVVSIITANLKRKPD